MSDSSIDGWSEQFDSKYVCVTNDSGIQPMFRLPNSFTVDMIDNVLPDRSRFQQWFDVPVLKLINKTNELYIKNIYYVTSNKTNWHKHS